MEKVAGMRRKAAENLAIQGLAYLAGDPERLSAFLAISGIGPDTIRGAAREPGFLAGVLDHIASDERLLLAFAADAGIDPADITRGRSAFAGITEGGDGF
jgi:hypothetical protein